MPGGGDPAEGHASSAKESTSRISTRAWAVLLSPWERMEKHTPVADAFQARRRRENLEGAGLETFGDLEFIQILLVKGQIKTLSHDPFPNIFRETIDS